DHPFYVQPALSSSDHMEAGGVAAGYAKPPRHAHLGAAIERALHMDRPQHIRQDIFWLEVCELLHGMPFPGRDCPPNRKRDARVLYCENTRLPPVLNDWLRRMVIQTLYGHPVARTIVLTRGFYARRHKHGKR